MKLLTDVPFASGEGRDRAFELRPMGVVLLISFLEVVLVSIVHLRFLFISISRVCF